MALKAMGAGTPELFAQGIAKAIESPEEPELSVRRKLLDLLACDEGAFCRTAGGLLLGVELPGSRHLVQFLLRQNLFIEVLAGARGYNSERARALVHGATKIGPLLGDELEKALTAALHKAPTAENVIRILRILELTTAASMPRRLLAFQHELMAYPDPKIRSKAALLTGCSAKNVATIGRLLRDENARVQANGLESLWSLDSAAARALLFASSHSPHNRVRGNALVGLYAIAEVESIAGIFEMGEHSDPRFRATAMWAMGKTGDSRFSPFLTDRLRQCAGGERLAILRALTRIRKNEKAFAEADALDILISSASIEPDGSRHIVLALRGKGGGDLSSVPATRFALWEGATPARTYEVLGTRNPALLISGIVAPGGSADDPYTRRIDEALTRCLERKRADDLWRIGRYAPGVQGSPPPVDAASPPPEKSAPDAQPKTHHGFQSSAEDLGKAISSATGSVAKTASGALEAIERAAEAISNLSGARHLFVFFHPNSIDELVTEPRRVEQLAALVRDERIVVHGFAPDDARDAGHFDNLCRAAKGGAFELCVVSAIPDTLERIFTQLFNRYDITYRMAPATEPPNEGKLVISGPEGCGSASYALAPAAAGTQ